MPIGTAVHARTFPLAETLNFREWSGYYAVSAYEAHHDHEYNAIRNAAALIDVSPLFKYIIAGPDAGRLVAMEMFPEEDTDPCELLFSNDAEAHGAMMPHTIEVRHGDDYKQVFTIDEFQFASEPAPPEGD